MADSQKPAVARDVPPDDQAGASTNNHPDFLWLPRGTAASGGNSSSANLADWQANYRSSAGASEANEDGVVDARDFLTWRRMRFGAAQETDGPSTLADLKPESSTAAGSIAAPLELPDGEPEIDLDL